MSFLEERSLTNVALELLFAGVFLHVPCHVLGCDGLPTNAAVRRLFALGHVLLLVVGPGTQHDLVLLLTVTALGGLYYLGLGNVGHPSSIALIKLLHFDLIALQFLIVQFEHVDYLGRDSVLLDDDFARLVVDEGVRLHCWRLRCGLSPLNRV